MRCQIVSKLRVSLFWRTHTQCDSEGLHFEEESEACMAEHWLSNIYFTFAATLKKLEELACCGLSGQFRPPFESFSGNNWREGPAPYVWTKRYYIVSCKRSSKIKFYVRCLSFYHKLKQTQQEMMTGIHIESAKRKMLEEKKKNVNEKAPQPQRGKNKQQLRLSRKNEGNQAARL